jgi:hypothetical protein
MSIRIRSGRKIRAFVSASRPSTASPQSAESVWDESIPMTARRTHSLSSAIRILMNIAEPASRSESPRPRPQPYGQTLPFLKRRFLRTEGLSRFWHRDPRIQFSSRPRTAGRVRAFLGFLRLPLRLNLKQLFRGYTVPPVFNLQENTPVIAVHPN